MCQMQIFISYLTNAEDVLNRKAMKYAANPLFYESLKFHHARVKLFFPHANH